MNVALLLAGGVGARITSDIPKQYICINGKMMITYALETLIASSYIDEIQIVAEPEWREYIIADCEKQNIPTDKIRGFAVPGFSRQTSILNGLQNILREKNGQVDIHNMKEDDNVLIHDASRPLVTIQQINGYFAKLSDEYDGVVPALNGKKLFAEQAPELFNLKKYYQANMALMPNKLKDVRGSAEPAIMAGMNLVMVPGDKNNFNITTQADLDSFSRFTNF